MGRKAISDVPKTDKPLKIRLTEAERQVFDQTAQSAGKPTSTWARDILMAVVETASPKPAPTKRKSQVNSDK